MDKIRQVYVLVISKKDKQKVLLVYNKRGFMAFARRDC